MPISRAASSPARTQSRSTSTTLRSCTSSIRLGWIRPSPISSSSDSRATSRRTGSKQLRITAPGVSSMTRLTPVTCSKERMLRPSRPMIRPFMSSAGSCTTEDHALAGLLGGQPLDRGGQDPLGADLGLLLGGPLDVAGAAGRRCAGPRARWTPPGRRGRPRRSARPAVRAPGDGPPRGRPPRAVLSSAASASATSWARSSRLRTSWSRRCSRSVIRCSRRSMSGAARAGRRCDRGARPRPSAPG